MHVGITDWCVEMLYDFESKYYYGVFFIRIIGAISCSRKYVHVYHILIIRKYFGINEADIYIDVNMKFTYIFMIFYDRYYVTDDIADCNYNFFRNGSFCQGILCFNFSFDYIVLKYVMLLVYFFIKHCSFSWKIYTSF